MSTALEKHNISTPLSAYQLSVKTRKRLTNNSHNFAPSLSSLSVLGLTHFHVFNVTAFDMLHVGELGMNRQFCYLPSAVI